MEQPKGLVYNIERFAITDGPGIRTLVYMKGCPIRCLWCSSPQTQKALPEILYTDSNCKRCGQCFKACTTEAVALSEEEGVSINEELCTRCGLCAEACPNQALELAGKYMTVEELFREIEKDSPFYRRSNGGVTIGGGEPTMQHEFVAELLKMCKRRYIHTAIETCGYIKWEYLRELLRYVDLVFFDIKHMDALAHRRLTSVSNELILENARRASALGPMIIRIPVVPGCNDSDDNILATARFAAELGENLKRIELLPYHQFGTPTYGRLNIEYKLKDVKPPSDNHMKRLKELVESYGAKAQIGG